MCSDLKISYLHKSVLFLTNSYVSQTFLLLFAMSAHLMGCIVEGGSHSHTYLME